MYDCPECNAEHKTPAALTKHIKKQHTKDVVSGEVLCKERHQKEHEDVIL